MSLWIQVTARDDSRIGPDTDRYDVSPEDIQCALEQCGYRNVIVCYREED